MKIYFGWKKCAGLICLDFNRYSLHLFCSREHWIWGFEEDYYNGKFFMLGGGPLFLFCWEPE